LPILTVILVDDDDAVRDSVETHLRASGLRVVAYASAADCLAEYRAVDGGCLVADLQLSGMSGLELIEALSARGGRIPTILMSANPTAAARVRAAALGVRVVLQKPFSGSVLLVAIEDALRAPGS
jgi:FixJ family two-component response regulator